MAKISFTKDETIKWQSGLPTKRCSSKVGVRNANGDILILKPTYQDYWQVPGGINEAGESPRSAGIREFFEETGLRLNEDQLQFAGIKYSAAYDIYLDFLHFFFDAGTLSAEQIKQIKLNPKEHSAFDFIKLADIDQRIAAHEVVDHLRFFTTPALPNSLYSEQNLNKGL